MIFNNFDHDKNTVNVKIVASLKEKSRDNRVGVRKSYVR